MFTKGPYVNTMCTIVNPLFKFLNTSDQRRWGHTCLSSFLTYSSRKGDHQSDVFLSACAAGLHACVYLMLESDTALDVSSGMCLAASNGHAMIVDRLLQLGVSDSVMQECVVKAIEHGHLSVIKCLFEWGVNVQDYLNLAVIRGHVHLVHWLTTDVGEALHPQAIVLASWKGNLDLIQYLVSEHLESQIDAVTRAIELAAKNGHLEIVNILVHLPSINTEQSKHAAYQLAVATASHWIADKLAIDEPTKCTNAETTMS